MAVIAKSRNARQRAFCGEISGHPEMRADCTFPIHVHAELAARYSRLQPFIPKAFGQPSGSCRKNLCRMCRVGELLHK